MLDIKQAEKEARAEINKELVEAAKGKIKAKLRQIAQAKQVVVNLENEYALLLREIGSDV